MAICFDAVDACHSGHLPRPNRLKSFLNAAVDYSSGFLVSFGQCLKLNRGTL
jgi:hypothetical protein